MPKFSGADPLPSDSRSTDAGPGHTVRLGRSLSAVLRLGVLVVVAGLGIAGSAGGADEGAGAQIRIGHIEGQGVPQVLPVTPLELFPFYQYDNQLLFSDLRTVITNDGTFAGNVGFGYRMLNEDLDRVFGASFWYDLDDARQVFFQQVGLSFDTYGQNFDVRGNVYLPVGPMSRQDSLTMVNNSLTFQDQSIYYSQARTWYTAMRGFDMEAGMPIPGDFSKSIDLRAYVGGYFYRNEYHDIPGVSGRVRANLLPGLDAEVQVTHDSFFETRAFAGISWTFGPLHYSRYPIGDMQGRLAEHITRNYTVVATHQRQIEQVQAVNPTTGSPYRVAHVASGAAPGGTGGVSNPFQSISTAQGTAADIVLVHAGSVFTGADAQLAMSPGQRILGQGDGIQHIFQVPELGNLYLPQAGPAGSRPVLQGAPGDSVLLASHSEFNGFNIVNPTGRGLVGDGIAGSLVQNVTVSGAGGNGLELLNTSGTNQFVGLVVADSAANGIRVSGGAGTNQFTGVTTVNGSGGPSIALHDLVAGSRIEFENLNIGGRHDRGLEVDNVAGVVTVAGQANIDNSAGSLASAVDIRNSSGTFAFNTLQVTDAQGAPGVNLQDNTGVTVVSILNVSSNGATAVRTSDAGTFKVNPAGENGVDLSRGGAISALNGTAIDIEETATEINLTSISSKDAAIGMRLFNTTGSFTVWGNGTAGSGGTIEGATTGIQLQQVDAVGLNWMTLDGNGTGLAASHADLVVLQNTLVENSTAYGVDLLDVQAFQIIGSILRDNAGPNVRAQFDQLQSNAYYFGNSNFVSKTSDNIVFNVIGGGAGSALNLQLVQNQFDNQFGGTAAVRTNWNGALTGTANQNIFEGSGGSNTGLVFNNTGSTLSSLSVTNNIFHFTGGSDTAVSVATVSGAQTAVTNNLVHFDAANGTGFRFNVVSPTITLANNTIRDTVGGATGFLFDSVTGPGTITLNSNLIDLSTQNALLDRGVIFSTVTNSIQLFSSSDNAVNNAAVNFFAPGGTTTGSVSINGTRVP